MDAEPTLDTRTVREWALELGIDELGVCHAEPYTRAEAMIADRRARGLFADLRFTMSRTETSCHPERLVDDARSVVSAALCYWHPEPAVEELGEGAADASLGPRGRLARYTRDDAYVALAERLETIADRLRARGHDARVLVDSNDHVDREAAIRSGVGFSGKHTNVITRRVGSWVVLGTLVTDAPLEPTPPMRPGCGSCTACIDACPTDALVDVAGGELDATRCITYWTQSRHSIPLDVREAMGDIAYGCDICQDACPWNRGVEGRRSGDDAVGGGVDLVRWLQAEEEDLDAEWQRLFVPRRRMRYLRRNALVALGNSGHERDAALAAPFLDSDDAMLREHASWALRKLGGPVAAAALARHGA
ncbi:MAG: Iron-sulfur cluster binding protein [Thermoleophilia bacterium]|nr:Iron-sulfur cluster binding protein [Thermoleophilia bacterium]